MEFARQLLVQAVADGNSRFRGEWIERAFVQAAQSGFFLVDHHYGPERTFTGVDLAVGSSAHHDESAIFTLALLPDGRRRVLALEAGRWTAPEIVARIRATRERFRSTVRVETNAAQAYIAQFLASGGIPVESHVTGKNRHDPAYGIESLAVELEQDRWIVPDAPATRQWARELIAYSPRSHAGDRLIAAWLAREAARAWEDRGARPVGLIVGETVFDENGDTELEDGFDDGSWVLSSSPPSLPLKPYQRWGSREIGGGARGVPARERTMSRCITARSDRTQIVGESGGPLRPFWRWKGR